MGMFDDVQCLYPLPDPAHNALAFQSKEFDCSLATYRITPEGELWLLKYDRETRTRSPLRRIPHHGDVSIYAHTLPNFEGDWIEYEVRFTEGKVTGVTRIPDEDAATPTEEK